MLLNYEQIRMDGGTQPRAELQKEVMEDYAELMRAGVKFPPLVVFHDGEDYWLADGFHRMGAALRAFPSNPIEVDVIQGTLQEAQWYSFGVNKTHGLRRTREDLKRVVKAAIRHPEAANRSDYELAEHVGIDRKTVAKYRAEMKPESGKRTAQAARAASATSPQWTSHPGNAEKLADARRYGYLHQMAFYRAIIHVALGIPMPVHFIAVEKKEPHRAGVWQIHQDALAQAQKENEAAIERLKRCVANDTWPSGYEEKRIFDSL